MTPNVSLRRSKGVALQGIPLDHHSSFLSGAAGAPPLIRESLYSDAVNLWTENGFNLGDPALFRDIGDASFPDPNEAFRSIEQIIGDIVKMNRIPLSLGGDHSITFPIIRALNRMLPGFAILQLDAHPDLYHEFQGDPFSHACPFARIMEEQLVSTLVQVGIRTLNDHQKAQAEKFGVAVIQMKDWKPDPGIEFKVPLYISMDMDVLDPAFAPGVSHHEPGGLTSRQLIDLIRGIRAPLIIGADVVEFNPSRDIAGITAMAAAKAVKELSGKILEINGIEPSIRG